MPKHDPDAGVRPTVRERLADAVEISKEIVTDTVLLSGIGDRELTVENYKSILEYTEQCIRIKANPYPLRILGRQLELRTITRDLLYITGRIGEVAFCREAR